MATFCVILKINSRKQHRKRQRPLAKGMIGCLCRVSQYCVYGQIMLGEMCSFSQTWRAEWPPGPGRSRWNAWSRESRSCRSFSRRCSARSGCTSCQIPVEDTNMFWYSKTWHSILEENKIKNKKFGCYELQEHQGSGRRHTCYSNEEKYTVTWVSQGSKTFVLTLTLLSCLKLQLHGMHTNLQL